MEQGKEFVRLSSAWHDDGFSDGLRGVKADLHPDNPYRAIYGAGYKAGLRRKLLNDAAPDLLDALRYALHVRGTTEDGPHVVEIIESAIAKARGE